MVNDKGDQSKKLIKSTKRGAQIPMQYAMLSEADYDIWDVKMMFTLRSLVIWSAIDGEDKYEDKDQGVVVAIS